MAPKRTENEEELNENAAEGQNAAHDNSGKRFGVENLFRNDPGNGVGPNRVFDRTLFITVKRAEES